MKKMKFITIVTSLANIALSIIVGRIYGVAGIFFVFSFLVFFFTIVPEAIILYKYKFEKSSIRFFVRYFARLLFMACSYFVTSRILMLPIFNFAGWIGFFEKALLSAFITGALFVIVFFRDKNFRALCSRVLYLVKTKINK